MATTRNLRPDPSTITHKSPPLSLALRGEPGSQKELWALPPGAYSPRGQVPEQIIRQTDAAWKNVQNQCGPEKRAACAVSDPGKDPVTLMETEKGNQENVTKKTGCHSVAEQSRHSTLVCPQATPRRRS